VKLGYDELFKILSNEDSPTYTDYVFIDSVNLPEINKLCLVYMLRDLWLLIMLVVSQSIQKLFQFNIFQDAYGSTDIVLEMEIEYLICYKMVDFICMIQGYQVGVSVTRAMKFIKRKVQGFDVFTKEDA